MPFNYDLCQNILYIYTIYGNNKQIMLDFPLFWSNFLPFITNLIHSFEKSSSFQSLKTRSIWTYRKDLLFWSKQLKWCIATYARISECLTLCLCAWLLLKKFYDVHSDYHGISWIFIISGSNISLACQNGEITSPCKSSIIYVAFLNLQELR